MYSFIEWNISPEIYTLTVGDLTLPIAWYGLLFASGFILGQQILFYIFKKEQKPATDVQSLTIYISIATIIGARLGHFLFYEWPLLLSNPTEWLLVLLIPPFRGLASHGATLAIIVAIYLYAKKKPEQPFLWVMDRLIIPVTLGCTFIRIGNLFNSEIYGIPTTLPWGFVFIRETEPSLLPLVPRHPTQIYEALFYLSLFAGTFLLWRYKRHVLPYGFISGLTLILLFGFRFFIEFLKNNQTDFENNHILNMGQILSIPAIITGIVILFLINRHKSSVST
ncbi:prolipoprotein diacylglyceryl transferase [Xanthocytophaga agilis]|uniref:Phosphatidylglycerol--prolipoprotein diacylglyceryl transferase n=1 Tax=Xanthocytophaga agilis TaxID=3048010 RepID=A0AAE3UET7_9BACT|nr:prolipoprotein diacylglyceryl transferase [Xanthocytophaga agilis]MDJ1503098.1 prolipoprotein diacylglyceryl transferase [Xanthocytophaga agilis]